MHFEKSVEIDAPQQRVWDVLSDLEAWPQRIETVDVVELLTPAPFTEGSQGVADEATGANGAAEEPLEAVVAM